jgi:pimeloyl-ACP methyl ester carboxylesterase
MLSVEKDMIDASVKNSNVQHITKYHMMPNTELHFLKVVEKGGNETRPNLVLIHGTGGSSASWFPVLDGLAKHFTVYVLDLPGFGRSDGPTNLAQLTPTNIVDYYSTFIHGFFKEVGIVQASVIAHSYGAYFAVKFAVAHPKMVSNIMLINPAGTFATQAGWGAWFATLFKNSFPQCVARLLGSINVNGWYTYFDIHGSTDLENTYFKTQLWTYSVSDITVASFIGRTFLYSYWKHPMLRDIIGLQMPLSLVYGETDKIIPYHNGVAISEISDGNVPCYILQGGGHAPFKGGKRPELFVKVVLDAFAIAAPFNSSSKEIATMFTDDDMCRFKTSFSFTHAMEDIKKQYQHYKQLTGTTLSKGKVMWMTEADLVCQ